MPSHRTPIVGGNWKMNTTIASARELARAVVAGCEHDRLIQSCDVALFPPFPYLSTVRETLGASGVLLGAQNFYHQPDGAFTGEVSADMLLDLDVGIVIAGHSERRHVLGENDELVNLKGRAALDAGLWVILCIGETLDQREAEETERIVLAQLSAGLAGVPIEQMRQVIIAYEPVWAIGTGEVATPEDAQEVCAAIRTKLAELYSGDLADAVRVLYGGSVKANNVASIMAQEDVDGALVGGASIVAEEFSSICRYRDHHKTD